MIDAQANVFLFGCMSLQKHKRDIDWAVVACTRSEDAVIHVLVRRILCGAPHPQQLKCEVLEHRCTQSKHSPTKQQYSNDEYKAEHASTNRYHNNFRVRGPRRLFR